MSKTIGQRIRELRELKGLTQQGLANLIGCAQNTIAAWEKQENRAPNKKLLERVAQVLEVLQNSARHRRKHLGEKG